jgi:hypothetical protein
MTNATWESIKEDIVAKNTGSKAWKSDCNSLVDIIAKLDEEGINPELMNGTKISNIRRIIPPMKVALKDDNLKEAVKLMKVAKVTKVIDLRLQMDPSHPKEITYTTRRTNSEKMEHIVVFNHKQFKAIRNRLRDSIKFVEN